MKNHFKYTTLMAGCLVLLCSCEENEWNDKLDGFEVPPVYSKTETLNYTLTEADYKTIANSKDNQAIAKELGESEETALKAVGNNGCFATAEQARRYIPALLSSSSFPYFAVNNGSSVKVDYILTNNQDPEVLAINAGVKILNFTKEDYQALWGSKEEFIMGFAPATAKPATVLPGKLLKAFPDATAGEYAVVNYNEAAENPDFSAGTTYFEETFASSIGNFTFEDIKLPSSSSYVWSYDNRGYAKASGYVSGTNYDSESWLVSPQIELPADANASLSFEQAWNYFANIATAESENSVGIRLDGETEWTILSPETVPTKLGWTFVNSGKIDLSAFNGKKFQIGFRYVSTAAKAGTTEIKNVKVSSGIETPTENKYAIYKYDGSAWIVPGSTSILQGADYEAMGYGASNYITTSQAKQLLPAYLATNMPYAQEEAAQIVVYRSGSSAVSAMQLVKTDGVWSPNLGAKIDQFTKMNGVWVYNPSVVITLPYARSTEPSYTYYVGCVRWVFENIAKPDYGITDMTAGGGFVRNGGEAEYWSGASGFYGNVDVRAITAKNNAPEGYTGYDGLSDDEISFLVKKRFCLDTMRGSLEYLHPEAEPGDGMEVTYTINFTSYGAEVTEESLVYVVSAPGKFRYKSCSWFTQGEDEGWE